MNRHKIPFNRPSLAGSEFEYIDQAIRSGHVSGDGTFTQKCSSFLETYLNAPKVLLTPSCTHALEMAALLLDLHPGDEVVLPSFTFVSTANAFVLRGAIPVFADIRPDTLNLDENTLAGLITPRTKAIVLVHYAGVGCNMEKIQQIASGFRVPVIEDNAHGLFGKYKGKQLGTFGNLAALSFHETKNITCGEGGALIINRDEYVARAEIIRDKGTNRGRFFRGQVDKYTWVDVGSSYVLSDILAAFLYAQLEKHGEIQPARQAIWNKYYQSLADWAASREVQLPFVPDDCESAYHMFHILMPTFAQRQAMIHHLANHGILSVFHYVPLHRSPMALQLKITAECPVTDSVSDRIIRLPFFNNLTNDEQGEIIEAVQRFS